MTPRTVYKQGPNGPLHDENPDCAVFGCIAVELLEDPPAPTVETITAEAERLVFGDRQEAYQHPSVSFTQIAAVWNALLGDRLSDPLAARDVALLMAGMKLAREATKPKRDNRVDIAGYALCLDRLEEGQ